MNHAFLLELLRNTKAKRKRLIENASEKELNAIRNFCFNICKGKFQVSSKVYKKLCKYKKDIRDLSNKNILKTSHAVKKRLIQRGGWLPLVLPALLGFISSVGSKIVERAIAT